MRQLVSMLLLVALLPACKDDPCEGLSCDACEAPIALSLANEEGEAIDARITGASSQCSDGNCVVGVEENRSGKYRLEINAANYKSKVVVFTVEKDDTSECCSCGYKPLSEKVVLEPDCAKVICDACSDSAIQLQVVDATTGAPLDGLKVAGAEASCGGGACEVGSEAGDYEFTVSSPGYRSETINLTVESDGKGCCPCPTQPVFRRVLLVPEDS